MNKYLTIALASTLIVVCRPYEEEGGVSNTPDLGAALASGQTESAIGTPYVGITVEELGALVETPETETANIVTSSEFNFPTSRAVALDLYVEEARGVTTDVVLCTDYSKVGDTYDVDYNSCIMQAEMLDGQLTTELDIVNQYERLLGVVWFQDEGTEPVFQEFEFEMAQ